MFNDCNDKFHHAVYADSELVDEEIGGNTVGTMNHGRVSLVFKKAMDRNGRKGHGKMGEGRRRRRQR